MSFFKQKEFSILLFIAFVVFIMFNYYTGIAAPQANEFVNWGAYLWNFSMILGTISLFQAHGGKILKKSKDWAYSILIFVSFIVYFIAMYTIPDAYKFILNNIQVPINLAIWVTAFSVFIMIFRGARTKSWLGILLLLSAAITVLRMAPIGYVIWPGFATIGNWMNSNPNSAVMSAITICMGIGLIATMIRELLGKESHYLGD
jgi:hypothetical protein